LLPNTASPPNAPAPQAQVPNAIFAIIPNSFDLMVQRYGVFANNRLTDLRINQPILRIL
jgi:hypothetical protein